MSRNDYRVSFKPGFTTIPLTYSVPVSTDHPGSARVGRGEAQHSHATSYIIKSPDFNFKYSTADH